MQTSFSLEPALMYFSEGPSMIAFASEEEIKQKKQLFKLLFIPLKAPLTHLVHEGEK